MNLHNRIARRAYALFENRGRTDGRDLADWLQAEQDEREQSRSHYFDSAIQYYVAGRFAMYAGLVPVAGNILHHAIERALKGALTRTTSPDHFKTRYGHSLKLLWEDFKSSVTVPRLGRFDRTVQDLSHFENIRYPDRIEGRGMLATMGPIRRDQDPSGQTKLLHPVPRYQLYLPEVDELLDTVFTGAGVNPAFYKFLAAKKEAADFLARDNTTRLRDLSR